MLPKYATALDSLDGRRVAGWDSAYDDSHGVLGRWRRVNGPRYNVIDGPPFSAQSQDSTLRVRVYERAGKYFVPVTVKR